MPASQIQRLPEQFTTLPIKCATPIPFLARASSIYMQRACQFFGSMQTTGIRSS